MTARYGGIRRDNPALPPTRPYILVPSVRAARTRRRRHLRPRRRQTPVEIIPRRSLVRPSVHRPSTASANFCAGNQLWRTASPLPPVYSPAAKSRSYPFLMVARFPVLVPSASPVQHAFASHPAHRSSATQPPPLTIPTLRPIPGRHRVSVKAGGALRSIRSVLMVHSHNTISIYDP